MKIYSVKNLILIQFFLPLKQHDEYVKHLSNNVSSFLEKKNIDGCKQQLNNYQKTKQQIYKLATLGRNKKGTKDFSKILWRLRRREGARVMV